MSGDDLGTILLAVKAAIVPAPEMKPWANEMERLAVEVDLVDREAELEQRIRDTLAAAEVGRFKHVRVNMFGVDGNAFMILGTVLKAMGHYGIGNWERAVFKSAAISGTYENLLRTCNRWVTIVNEPVNTGSAVDAFGL